LKLKKLFEIDLFNHIKLWKIIFVVILWNIWYFIIINYLKIFVKSWFNIYSVFDIFNDPSFIIYTIIGILFMFFYFLLLIPITISLIKGIKNIYNWQKLILSDITLYWFKNIFESFKTYFYIFSYVILIPFILLIILSSLYIFWYFWNIPFILLNILSLFVLIYIIYTIIYKWIKSKLALYSAIDKNKYSKENFLNSIKISQNNWWRIFWNILLLWLIFSIISRVITILPWINSFNFNIFELKNEWINLLLNNYSFWKQVFSWIIKQILSSFIFIYSLIFFYLLYKRLELDFLNSNKSNSNTNIKEPNNNSFINKKIEL